jgi:hypothetical protein
MLNPSTADAHHDDPTVRRCVGFSRREGCTGLVIVNLYSWRSPNPRDVWDALEAGWDPWGPHHDRAVSAVIRAADGPVIAAWGANRAAPIGVDRFPAPAAGWWCLGTTKDGSPRHPLYVRGSAPLVRWADPRTPPPGTV